MSGSSREDGNHTQSLEIYEMRQPLGLFSGELYERGREYLNAFECLIGQRPNYIYASYFMLAHALELLFKSFLAAHGVEKTDMLKRHLRHNLPSILLECEKFGLNKPAKLTELVSQLHEMNKDNDFRYPTSYQLSLPQPSECLQIACELMEEMAPLVERTVLDAELRFASETRAMRGKKIIRWSD